MNLTAILSCIENEFAEAENSKSWKILFTNLKTESDEINKDLEINEAKEPKNKGRNRYRDVLPYDNTRVVLDGIGDSDYINANYVQLRDSKHQRRYILTQGPLAGTVPHFWRMVWTERSTCIVMLNKVIEKDIVKCEQYFPLSDSDVITHDYDDLSLSLSLIEYVDKGAYVKRVMLLVNKLTDEERRITQFHYISWPDFGVPVSPVSFLNFLAEVRSSGGLDDRDCPCVVHCSAGIGRSGTFVLIDLALLRIAEKIEESAAVVKPVNVREMINELRQCRMGLVQSSEQLRFAYLAIIVGSRSMIGGAESGSVNLDDLENCPPLDPVDTDYDETYSELGSESDTDDSADDIMRSNPALDQAAAAVRSRRGLPLNDDQRSNVTQASNTDNMIGNNVTNNNAMGCLTNNNINNDDTSIIDERKQIREMRCNRTRAKLDEIRTKMRRHDLERTRFFNRIGLSHLPLSLTGRTRNSFIMGVSVLVGVVSLVCGVALYKYNGVGK